MQVHGFFLAWEALVWLAAFQISFWLAALAYRRTLICWSVGPLGITAVYLRRPPRGVVVVQVTVPIVVFACASFIGLYLVQPAPIGGLSQRPLVRVGTTLVALLAAAALQALRFLGDLRFPVWGEARVLACAQRSRALGGIVLFTSLGRTYLRERFGATPREFLLTVS